MSQRIVRGLFALLIGAFAAVPAAPAQAPIQAPPPLPLNLTQIQNEAVTWLENLIRINTTNPPGNELAAAKYLATVLNQEEIPSETFQTAPGRAFLVARLQASALPDPSRALLLMGHLDVVGVDRSKWTVDPFRGIIQDNYIFGRGAIDDKGMVVANMAVLIALKRSAAKLDRDVIFLAEDDEEAGGEQGMKIIVDKYWDKIAAGYAINEGGQVVVKGNTVQYVGLQISEKIMANVDVIASGTSGHASVPRKDNPVVHLADALSKIADYQTPVQFNSVTRAYFEGLAPLEDEETRKWMSSLDTGDRAAHAAHWISEANPAWSAMLRDTITPTMLQAGVRQNVIPAEARAVLNLRMLPGDIPESLVMKLQQLVNDPQIRFSVEPGEGVSAPSSSTTSDLYNTISKITQQEFPGAAVLPYMSTGGTDSEQLRLRSVQAYGLLPFPLTEDDFMRMHADNERVPLNSFQKGIEFLYNIVNNFAVAK